MNALRPASSLAAVLVVLATVPAAADCRFPVTSYVKPPGAATDDLAAVARFADVTLTPDAVGYGAAGERRDEITVANGTLFLVRSAGEGHATRRKAEPEEGPLMMHLVPVRARADPRPLWAAGSLDELAARLDAAVAAAGCGADATLAFRIEGRAAEVTWSLDSRPERREVKNTGESVTIVGLYSTTVGAYALPAGRRFHAHVVVPGVDGAGHVRAVRLVDGGNLRLQAR